MGEFVMGNSSFTFPTLSQNKAKEKAAQLLRDFPTTIKDIVCLHVTRGLIPLLSLIFQTRKCFWLTVKEIKST